MTAYLSSMGVSFEPHEARQMSKQELDWADLVLVMERRHEADLEKLWPDAKPKGAASGQVRGRRVGGRYSWILSGTLPTITVWPSLKSPLRSNPWPNGWCRTGKRLSTSRSLKNAHLRRCPHPSSLRRTGLYDSLLGISGALYLRVFEQPARRATFPSRSSSPSGSRRSLLHPDFSSVVVPSREGRDKGEGGMG